MDSDYDCIHSLIEAYDAFEEETNIILTAIRRLEIHPPCKNFDILMSRTKQSYHI